MTGGGGQGSSLSRTSSNHAVPEALEFQKGETVEWIVAEGGEIVLARPEIPSRTMVKKTKAALKVEKS
ncbi:MAG: hypothetical protein A2020_04950 [Lentisphaerae bacterium GWF2_45_14]|nr:MAG: hypothetical protein A2020_04950 [Lentisphaerae bacterium GWF2_45_14]